LIAATFQLERRLLQAETLAVSQSIIGFASDAIFAEIGYAAGGIGEADHLIEEVLVVTLVACSIDILDTVLIFELALEECVDEVAILAGIAEVGCVLPIDAIVFCNLALAGTH
jgi:hypothetical protein